MHVWLIHYINFAYPSVHFAVTLQKCFADSETSRNFPSTWPEPSFLGELLLDRDSTVVTLLLLFLLGLLLLCFVHAALQVLHGVQQLFRGLQDRVDFSAHFIADGIFLLLEIK